MSNFRTAIIASACVISVAYISGFAAEAVYEERYAKNTYHAPLVAVAEQSESVEASSTIEEIIQPTYKHYDNIPLEPKLQDHIINVCNEYGVDDALVFALIHTESRYDIYALGDNGRSVGMCQIQYRWHEERIKKLGITDLMNPYQNIVVGVDILSELLDKGYGTAWALMAYNGGYAHAHEHRNAGTVSAYVTKVFATKEEITSAVH